MAGDCAPRQSVRCAAVYVDRDGARGWSAGWGVGGLECRRIGNPPLGKHEVRLRGLRPMHRGDPRISCDREQVLMPESLRTKLTRIAYTYLFPAYRGTGGKITYMSDDW